MPSQLLLAHGARLDATSKVVNLTALQRRAPRHQPVRRLARPRSAVDAALPPAALPPSRVSIGPYSYNELVGAQGGLTPLLFAVRQGHATAVTALVEAGADVNAVSAGDKTSPLLMAIINGHFDLAQYLIERGAERERWPATTASRRSMRW